MPPDARVGKSTQVGKLGCMTSLIFQRRFVTLSLIALLHPPAAEEIVLAPGAFEISPNAFLVVPPHLRAIRPRMLATTFRT